MVDILQDEDATSCASTLPPAVTFPGLGGFADDLPGLFAPVTENGAVCHENTGSKCLDLFFGVIPDDMNLEVLHEMLREAWEENSDVCLKLIFNLVNCRKGEGGKMDRVNAMRSLLWLFREHPRTLLANLEEIVVQGCYKTLLDLIQNVLDEGFLERNLENCQERKMRACVERSVRKSSKLSRKFTLKCEFAESLGARLFDLTTVSEKYFLKKNATKPMPIQSLLGSEDGIEENGEEGDDTPDGPLKIDSDDDDAGEEEEHFNGVDLKQVPPKYLRWNSDELKRAYMTYCKLRDASLAEISKARKSKKKEDVKTRIDSMTPLEKTLYTGVARLFADGIVMERKALSTHRATGKGSIPGLCCKWAPTPNNMHDRSTLIVDAIVQILPHESFDTKGKTPRIRYNQAISEVRRASKIPESFVGRKEFDLVNYRHMPSLCRQVYGDRVFRKYDAKRYERFLLEAAQAIRERRDGQKGAPKVHTASLLPHDVIGLAEIAEPGDIQPDLMWHGLVKRVREARNTFGGGGGRTFVPVCDVSGSMAGIPMEVCVALGLLLAESAPKDSPVSGVVINFHDEPLVFKVPKVPDHDGGEIIAGSLAERVAWVKNLPWGGSTNFEGVFDQLLELCVENDISPDEVQNMFICVFSDMQFDEAKGQQVDWKTLHQTITDKWIEAGYGSGPPTIIYWNLRSVVGGGAPVEAKEEGALMLSGFSVGLLESFLAGRMDEFTPLAQMMSLLDKPCYNRLRVIPEI